MLEARGVEFSYRDYRSQPLSLEELTELFGKLGLSPAAALRTKDRANADLGLDGSETDAMILGAMAENPTLLQRPIGVYGSRAVIGRPCERLLDLLEN